MVYQIKNILRYMNYRGKKSYSQKLKCNFNLILLEILFHIKYGIIFPKTDFSQYVSSYNYSFAHFYDILWYSYFEFSYYYNIFA